MNIQYVVYNDEVYVIEVNPRSSRTVPYISKVTGVPMVDLATKIMLGAKLKRTGLSAPACIPKRDYVAVKVPVFSFEKLHDVDTQLGPEMKSTGEVLGIAKTFEEALLQGPGGRRLQDEESRRRVSSPCGIPTSRRSSRWPRSSSSMGFTLYATARHAPTCSTKIWSPANAVRKISEDPDHNVLTLLESGKVDYVISTSAKGRQPARDSVKIRRKAVERSIVCLTAVDTANAMADCLAMDMTMDDIELVDITTL